jgi:hypothetical protein
VQTYSQLPIITAAVDRCHGELPSWAIEFVRTFVAGMDLDLGGGATLKLFHSTPRSHMEDMVATTSPEALNEMLGDKRAVVTAGGHPGIAEASDVRVLDRQRRQRRRAVQGIRLSQPADSHAIRGICDRASRSRTESATR